MRDKFWKGKRVIVTGANGFLASSLTVNLLESGAEVWGIINKRIKGSYLDAYLKAHPKAGFKELYRYSIVNSASMNGLFKRCRPDVCFHLAAQAIVGEANKTPIPTFKTNIQGTWNILDAARAYSPDTAVVVASSDKAYGEHKKLPYTEDAGLQALHPYDASKSCADILTRTYAHTYGLKTAVTRCANIYGPGDMNFSRIIPDTLKRVLSAGKPVLRSDGTPVRDYIYVEDAVAAYLCLAKALIAAKPGIKGQAFNFGTGRPVRVIELVRLACRLCGRPDVQPRILSKTKIKGEIDRQYLSSARARRILGWRPQYSLSRGLENTIAWYIAYLAQNK